MTIFQNSIGRWALHDGATYQYFNTEQEARMAELIKTIGEQPAEYEIAKTIVEDVLPQLRAALLALSALEMTWQANELDTVIENLSQDDASIAGMPIAAWRAWAVVFKALKIWLSTPLDDVKATPLAVLMRRYAR